MGKRENADGAYWRPRRFVADVSFERLAAEAVDVARVGFIDGIATMIAGADDPAPQLLRKALRPGHGDPGLYFSGETVPAPKPAWTNGTAGGEALRASGRDMLAAYVAGYETWAKLAWRDPGHHHRKGWHPTGIFGPIGAAACASLRRLDAEHASNALALAASQSSGVTANFGTMTTPFHAGRSAHSGLITARLAEVGFTAAPDAIEHPQGFLSAVSRAGEADRETPAQALGSEWKILKYRLGIKKYPACYCTHRALDA
jgi:2-methylcitrate dehydratase PrpD